MDFLLSRAESEMLEFQAKLIDIRDSCDCSLQISVTKSNGTGKWGLSRLWRMWVKVASDWMADNGATMPLLIDRQGNFHGSRRFSAQDGHDLFCSYFLGLDEGGRRLSWVRSEGENVASKAQRYVALQKLEQWCLQKGIKLPQPRESEYFKMKEEIGD